VQSLIDQLAQTKEQIEKNAQDIVRLQTEISRLQAAGKDIAEMQTLLAQCHAVHMQVLAVQAQLRKALSSIGRE
jgi:hypothetical protein